MAEIEVMRTNSAIGVFQSISNRMRMQSIGFLCAALTTMPLQGAAQESPSAKATRFVTVADSIGMTVLGESENPGGRFPFSPDGKSFIAVLRKGNLTRNTNEYSIVLWRTMEILQSPVPELLLTMSSSSNGPGIDQVRWLADSETISFLGEQPGTTRQVYLFNTKSHVLTQVTQHPTTVMSYSISRLGNAIAYTAQKIVEPIFTEQAQRTGGVVVTSEALDELVLGNRSASGYAELYFKFGAEPAKRLPISDGTAWINGPVFLSPNGRYVVVDTLAAKVPSTWEEYWNPRDRRLSEWIKMRLVLGGYSGLRRLTCLDTKTGNERNLLDAPLDINELPHAVWAPDGRSFAVSGVYLPLERTEGNERKERQSQVFVAEIEIPDGRSTKITSQNLIPLRWDSRDDGLIFQVPISSTNWALERNLISQKKRGVWGQLTESPFRDDHLSVDLEQGINARPKIFAFDRATASRVLLLDLNPQFDELQLAKVEEVEWKGRDGHKVDGGLYYPPDYTSDRRYPIVIQTHGWDPHRFSMDGPFTSGFAAQALAAKGIMVLQANEGFADMDTPTEVNREVAAIEGALDYLDSRGLVDIRRAGLVGFSRTGLYVKYILAKYPDRFSAASVADDVDGGYFQYVAFSNGYTAFAQFVEGVNGGTPFGPALKSWMERSPTFGIESVETPLRVLAFNPRSLLGEWEWFFAMRRLGKPVEMIYMQDGEHILEKPWQRMLAQQGNVDWFCFWLKEEEDPDPAKAGQYARWRELRKLQEKQVTGDRR